MPSAGELFCGACGAEHEDSDAFCPHCGAPTSRAAGHQEPSPEPPPGASTGRRIGRRYLIAGLAVALLAAGAAVFFLTRSDAPEQSRRIAAAAKRTTEAPVAALAEASTLKEVRGTEPQFKRAAQQLQRYDAQVSAIDRDQYRDAVSELVQAERQVIAQFAAIAALKPSTIGTFARQDASADASIEQLRAASAGVAKLDIEGVQAVLPRVETLSASLQHLRPVVRTANRKLARWRAEYRRFQAKQRSDLAVLAAYRGTMESHLQRYDGLRTEMQKWVDGIDADTTFSDAYEFLGEAASQRASLRDALKLQSPPPDMGSAHSQLMQVITEAVDAVNAAYDGISEYQYNREDYDDYTSVPGWQEFVSSSGSLASRYSSAEAQWRAALDKARREIKRRKALVAPAV